MISLGIAQLPAERRESSYTAQILDGQFAAASGRGGGLADAARTAAATCAAQWWGRLMSLASVTPASANTAGLDAVVLAHIGQALATRGEACFLIGVDDGRVTLTPASHWDIAGHSADPESWTYRLTIATPSTTRTVVVPASSTLHLRYAWSAARPWCGISPLSAASNTAVIVGGLERQTGEEASQPSGTLLAVPDLGDLGAADDVDPVNPSAADPLGALRDGMRRARGETLLVPSGRGGWSLGMAAGTDKDVPGRLRYGARPPQELTLMHQMAARWLTVAFGLPLSIVDPSAASGGSREGWRVMATVLGPSLGRIISTQASRALDAPVEFDFSAAAATDVAVRSRAVGSLVTAGMALDQAVARAGL